MTTPANPTSAHEIHLRKPDFQAAAPAPTGAPGEVAIRADKFDGWYGDFHALKGISLEIARCRVTAFIGPSGCGKSTFLRWMNRMNDSIPGARASGTLTLDGEDLLSRTRDVVELRRNVGMVLQKPNPFPKSIYDNVAFGPRLHRSFRSSDLDELVENSLRAAALWDEVKDRLKSSALGLSGGQQQRLCIARAIAVGPEVLLMDEPCSALDPRSTASIEQLIRELEAQYPNIIVTTNIQRASHFTDRPAFFFERSFFNDTATTEIYTNPRNKRTEDYVSGRFG